MSKGRIFNGVGYDSADLKAFKKNAKRVINDFKLKPQIRDELLKAVDEAETEREVNVVLRRARYYI